MCWPSIAEAQQYQRAQTPIVGRYPGGHTGLRGGATTNEEGLGYFLFNRFHSNDGSVVGLRYNQWKLVFAEQRTHGVVVWQEPYVTLRVPKLFNLRSDPFEMADRIGMDYVRWRAERLFLLVPAQQYVGRFLVTFKEFPPSQKVGSFSLDQVLGMRQKGGK